MSKVSIIVPVYNTSKYLSKCIESLINQTEKDIELVIINDGSTDNSKNIIKSYKDKRIKFIDKENEGIGKTRNKGIKAATGDYLMFIDSDDYIDINCVEEMYNYAVKNKSDLVISDFYKYINGKLEKIIIPDFKASSLKNNPEILNKVNLGPCNKLYNKKILNNVYFEETLKYEDAPFVIKALKNANKITKLNKCLSYYVIHNNSQTTVRDKKIFDILEIVKIIRNTLNDEIYHNYLTNLSVMMLTDYVVQQKYVKNKNNRNKFINQAFNLLNEIDSNWKKCDYMKNISLSKRFIKSHKSLVKIYCSLYVKLKKQLD